MRKVLMLLLLLTVWRTCPALAGQRAEVVLETTEGRIRIALYDETPQHRDNFLKLVEQHFYDSLLFHRVIANFMIQTGDPNSRHAEPGDALGDGDVGYTVAPEFCVPALYHRRGVVAAAREGDDVNPEQRSSGCQFYIVWGKPQSSMELDAIEERLSKTTHGRVSLTPDMRMAYRKVGGTPHLDGQYTVFGEVVEGLDVVEKIQKADTDDYDRPVWDIRILRATVVQQP